MTADAHTGQTKDGHIYVHIPGLALGARSFRCAGSELRAITFDELERLDGDWARRSYFVEGRQSFMIFGDGPDSDTFDSALNKALLFVFAVTCVNPAFVAEPRDSVRYYGGGESRSVLREVGASGRAMILARDDGYSPTTEVVEQAIARAETWVSGGLRHADSVFSPLRSLIAVRLANVLDIARVLPLSVSLESFVKHPRFSGSAPQRMASAFGLALRDRPPAEVQHAMKRMYAWRSDILHGRLRSIKKHVACFSEVSLLVTRLTTSAADSICQHRLQGDDLHGLWAAL